MRARGARAQRGLGGSDARPGPRSTPPLRASPAARTCASAPPETCPGARTSSRLPSRGSAASSVATASVSRAATSEKAPRHLGRPELHCDGLVTTPSVAKTCLLPTSPPVAHVEPSTDESAATPPVAKPRSRIRSSSGLATTPPVAKDCSRRFKLRDQLTRCVLSGSSTTCSRPARARGGRARRSSATESEDKAVRLSHRLDRRDLGPGSQPGTAVLTTPSESCSTTREIVSGLPCFCWLSICNETELDEAEWRTLGAVRASPARLVGGDPWALPARAPACPGDDHPRSSGPVHSRTGVAEGDLD